jgi:glycosyltransferase involved in cell wall biosynthesis
MQSPEFNLWHDYALMHTASPEPLSKSKLEFIAGHSRHIREANQSKEFSAAVVVIAHNEEAYLPRTLASIDMSLARLPKNAGTRVILVDNASTDSTPKVAEAFGAHVIYEARKGIGAARQAGLLGVKDEEQVVLTTDADSVVPGYWVNEMLLGLETNDAVMVYGRTRFLTDGRLTQMQKIQFYLYKALGTPNRLLRSMGKIHFPTSCNMAYNRQIAVDTGGYDVNLMRGEDGNLAGKLKTAGKVVFLKHIQVLSSNRRAMGEGLFNHGSDILKDYLKIMLHRQLDSKNYADHRV